MDLRPSEVLLLQRVHPETQGALWWLGAGSPAVGPAGEAQAWCSAQVPSRMLQEGPKLFWMRSLTSSGGTEA